MRDAGGEKERGPREDARQRQRQSQSARSTRKGGPSCSRRWNDLGRGLPAAQKGGQAAMDRGGGPEAGLAAPTSVSPERPSRVPRGRYCVSALQRARDTVIGTVFTHVFMHTRIRVYVYVYIHPYARRLLRLSGVRACVCVHAHSEGALHASTR